MLESWTVAVRLAYDVAERIGGMDFSGAYIDIHNRLCKIRIFSEKILAPIPLVSDPRPTEIRSYFCPIVVQSRLERLDSVVETVANCRDDPPDYVYTKNDDTKIKMWIIIIIFSSSWRLPLSPAAAVGSRHSSVASSTSPRGHLRPKTHRPGPCQCTADPRPATTRCKTTTEPVFSHYGTIAPPPIRLLLQ